jgi:uncharacterized SAM-binding protein YcdF (DUF218 family)
LNELLFSLGLQNWKPVLAALLLPPGPFIVLMVWGASRASRRRRGAWLLVWLGAAGLWFMGTAALATLFEGTLNRSPPALDAAAVAALRGQPATAIVVLGGGRRLLAPEYGTSGLKPRTAERLRYGVYLARQTGLPLALSGGRPDSEGGASEAEVAGRVAAQEFGLPLRWEEREARDTRDNARRTVPLLQRDGITHIVLVTQAYHMQRALRHFEQAAADHAGGLRITPAPMDMPLPGLRARDWLPSLKGYESVQLHLHELMGRVAGA